MKRASIPFSKWWDASDVRKHPMVSEIAVDMLAVLRAMSECELGLVRSVGVEKGARHVWHRVVADRSLPDSHPRFGPPYHHRRVLAHVEGWDGLCGYATEAEAEGRLVAGFQEAMRRFIRG